MTMAMLVDRAKEALALIRAPSPSAGAAVRSGGHEGVDDDGALDYRRTIDGALDSRIGRSALLVHARVGRTVRRRRIDCG